MPPFDDVKMLSILPVSPTAMSALSTPFRAKYDGEIKQFERGSKDKHATESMADMYSIIKAVEALETVYSRDNITPAEYAQQCSRLISQYKTVEQALINSSAISSAAAFFKEYSINCPLAYERLIISGVPATVLHASHDERKDSVIVAETTQFFITSLDALNLNQRATDEIQPLIADLLGSLGRVRGLAESNFEAISKLTKWLEALNRKTASEGLSDEEVRQLTYDLEKYYKDFFIFLKK